MSKLIYWLGCLFGRMGLCSTHIPEDASPIELPEDTNSSSEELVLVDPDE